ncbi:MAG TPA: HXXEE domain-containing protein [Ignavibacteriaceae bacterium]|nr:HXXEE domain-containing protein [Ignavibacteriaceae bacterium]
MYLLWLLPISAALHITEEFVFPGGFTAWYRNYKQSVSSSFTARYLININLILIILCILPLFLDEIQAVALWLSMASVVFFNAFFHIGAYIRTKKYVPGIVTSILIYIPMALYGYWYFLSSGKVSIEQAITSGSIGIIYLFFSAYNHKRRAKKLSSSTD